MANDNIILKVSDLHNKVYIFFKTLDLSVIINFWKFKENTKSKIKYEGDSFHMINFNEEINIWIK